LITMNRPSSSRRPGILRASASSCCLTPAATSSFCDTNRSTTAGEVGATVFAVPEGSLPWWTSRLSEAGVDGIATFRPGTAVSSG